MLALAILGLVRLPKIRPIIPQTAEEAVTNVHERPHTAYIAGGTFIVPMLKSGSLDLESLVDISELNELHYIKQEGEVIRIGALTTHAELVQYNILSNIPAFNRFKEKYTSPIAMNLATVGGSIALSEASEDLIPILLTLNANVRMLARGRKETVNLQNYITRRENYAKLLVEEVSFKLPKDPMLCDFDKVSLSISRRPLAGLAVNLETEGGKVKECRIAVSFYDGLKPGRVPTVEEKLKGRRITEEVINEASHTLKESIKPVGDFLASEWYRKEASAALLSKILNRMFGFQKIEGE